jgi:DNA-binding transcriptional regulator GbsR (MarR family)
MTIEDEIRRIAREEVERAMEEYTRPKAVPTTVKGKIINTLQVGGRPLSSIEICKALNMPKDTISPQLSKMHLKGW